MSRAVVVSVAVLLWSTAIGVAQAASAQDQDQSNSPTSLGDVARQSRAQHTISAEPSKAQALAEEMQQEEEASEAAPFGFKSYDAGDYRLFVPYPYNLEGRENGAAVLIGSRLGVTNTEVVAGTPISIPGDLSDPELLNVTRQLASFHGAQAYCSAIPLGTHRAFRCAWQGNPYILGHVVWGSMIFVVASNKMIPVMCVSPDSMHVCTVYDNWGHNTCSDRDRQMYGYDQRKIQAAANARTRDEQTTFQMCDQVIYPSITIKEEIVVHPATLTEGKTPKPTLGTVSQDTTVAAGDSQGRSLADLARETRQSAHGQAQAKLDNGEGLSVAPAGFQPFVIQYCLNPRQCGEASVLLPEKADVLSRVNGQHIFKIALEGAVVRLYAGPADVNAPYRSMTDADYIRMRDLANANGWSREKAEAVSTQELTIDDKPALITRFRYQRDEKQWWIGERALIQMGSAQFLLGCTAPEDRFADAEKFCTTLVNSLRLQ